MPDICLNNIEIISVLLSLINHRPPRPHPMSLAAGINSGWSLNVISSSGEALKYLTSQETPPHSSPLPFHTKQPSLAAFLLYSLSAAIHFCWELKCHQWLCWRPEILFNSTRNILVIFPLSHHHPYFSITPNLPWSPSFNTHLKQQ